MRRYRNMLCKKRQGIMITYRTLNGKILSDFPLTILQPFATSPRKPNAFLTKTYSYHLRNLYMNALIVL